MRAPNVVRLSALLFTTVLAPCGSGGGGGGGGTARRRSHAAAPTTTLTMRPIKPLKSRGATIEAGALQVFARWLAGLSTLRRHDMKTSRFVVTMLLMLLGAQSAWPQQIKQIIPAAGQWEMNMESSIGAGTVQFCSDGKNQPDLLNGAERTLPDNCRQDAERREGRTTIHRAVCEFDANVREETVARIQGDFKTAFTVEESTQRGSKGAAPVESTFKLFGRRLGACPADLKSGDFRMPNGKIIKAKDTLKNG